MGIYIKIVLANDLRVFADFLKANYQYLFCLFFFLNKICREMSFHQRERCLRGNCVLITRSNGPPVFECTFICLFVLVVNLSHSLLDLFFFFYWMMSFPLIQSLFARPTQFAVFFLSVWYFFLDFLISTKDQTRAVFSVSSDVL